MRGFGNSSEAAAAANSFAKATAERTSVRSCLKLLYEREFALEPIVRDILELLGANVEESAESNKEDAVRSRRGVRVLGWRSFGRWSKRGCKFGGNHKFLFVMEIAQLLAVLVKIDV